MSPMQQIFLGLGAVATKTYVDDVFSTFLYKGSSSTGNAINNGIDLAGEGGLVWLKSRGDSMEHYLFDTVRGATKYLNSASNNAEGTASDTLTSFNNNGFTLSDNGAVNSSSRNFASWNFRKASGFFDVVTYSGDGTTTGRAINHSLESKPGFIMVKRLDSGGSVAYRQWFCYHDALPDTYQIKISTDPKQSNGNDVFGTGSSFVRPTSTQFTVGEFINYSGGSYVAYLFAGGESTAATARSVDFDGSDDTLNIAASDDFHLTGDLTIEGWFKPDAYGSYNAFWCLGNFQATQGVFIYTDATQLHFWKGGGGQITTSKPPVGQWTHIAVVRSGSTVTMYINGTSVGSYTDSVDFGASNNKTFTIGSDLKNSSVNDDFFNGQISNLRVVKGTALYTSSFRPPTEPLTNITNTKLLCCNNSSVTGSTVTPSTITAASSPSASTDSPFDDPAAHVFGESGSESVIKTGSWTGSGSSGLEVNVGFEPQYILIKCSSNSGENWRIYDSMRGIVTGGNDPYLYADRDWTENSGQEGIEVTSTGFKLMSTDGALNGNGRDYIYICIRRPDGYVGKPYGAGEGTSVFAMDTAASAVPRYSSGFPVDLVLKRRPATAENWSIGARLIGKYRGYTNSTTTFGTNNGFVWDSNTHWLGGGGDDANVYQAWMWKRHAGFDVVCYKGTGSNQAINHSLGRNVEMAWIKRRDGAADWKVYHSGLDSSNPEDYNLTLNTTGVRDYSTTRFAAPTDTQFTVKTHSTTNGSGNDYIMMLFASVDGISKVGSYTGNGSTGQTITLGFQPRFVIIRKYNDAAHWLVLDTTRGWGSGDDKYLLLNSSGAQGDYEVGAPTSNGFTLVGDNDYNNSSGAYIYYAHA